MMSPYIAKSGHGLILWSRELHISPICLLQTGAYRYLNSNFLHCYMVAGVSRFLHILYLDLAILWVAGFVEE